MHPDSEIRWMCRSAWERTNIHGLMATLSLDNTSSLPCKLCSYCAGLQFRVTADEPEEEVLVSVIASQHRLYQVYLDFFPTFPALKQRATEGCSFCNFLRSSVLAEYERKGLDIQGKKRWVGIVLSAKMDERFECRSSFSMYKDEGPVIIRVDVPAFDQGRQVPMGYRLAFQTSSEATLTTRDPLSTENVENVKRWLKECQMNHEVCRSRLSGFTPSRLLDIKDKTLRLVTEADDSGYTALSYCWGSKANQKEHFLTTKSNIGSRRSGFALCDLPNTLRDAVRTTRALGIRYIWIDALCIIQDDPEDWSKESSRMGQIYSHACLTIAATTSKSSFDGFLLNRDPSYRTTSKFVFKEVQSFRSEPLMEKSGLAHFRYPPETSVQKSLSTCRWEERGWTLQERLLSTRILYFTKDVFYYECATTQRLENPGFELPKRIEFSALLAASHIMTESERLQKQESHLSQWYEVVKIYTKRKLTKSKDKLPAIEGLASELNNILNDTYIYGLWRMDLHRGLLWQPSSKSWKRPRDGYRAPTWSWACRDGGVSWDASTFKPGWKSLIQVNNIQPHRKCTCCNETIGAQLDLTAKVAPLKDILVAHLTSANIEDSAFLDYLNTCEFLYGFDEFDGLGTFTVDKEEDEGIYLPDVRMLLIAETAEPANIQALLIQPCYGSSHFERVGWFIQKQTLEHLNFLQDSEDVGPMREHFKSERLVLV
ncbi:hypothetical protein J7T55_006927 [Diaporthe amygdali]|uniref:uncharacterized protein n=1 Tax=Phomopsis amygdali TaxID=1214568 RepID=UPI0022FE7AB3|nr:uncharacterized protein J7T55_006927 [Diaporthe amygdali]KAJ0107049.1 hypothetical protein J7T55_006927 [Diaporthe amygdali]